MARNVLGGNFVVKVYCSHFIPFLFSVSFIYMNIQNYDSDDLPMTQMERQHDTEVNTQYKDAEDEEDDENYKKMSNEGSNEGTFFVCH